MHEITTQEVRARQLRQLSSEEQSRLENIKLSSLEAEKQRVLDKKGVYMGSAWKSLLRASEHIFERKSVVKGHEVIAEALNRNLGFISLEALRRYMKSAYNGIIQLTQDTNNPILSSHWTSARGLRLEREAIEFVNQTQDCCNPLGKIEDVAFDFKSGEQRKAVLETLSNRDRVYAIRGCAGAGKTTCLSEVRKGLEAAGRTAIYLAPTSSAVDILRKDGFTAAATVDSFLVNRQKYLTDDAVVIIDESSLQSTEMGSAILDTARNARVLFVGDTRQHVSVEAGDFLRVLEQHSTLRYSELKDIRRQVTPEYNAAVRTLSHGDAAGGMAQLNELGWIKEGRGAYIEQAADAYFDATAAGTDLNRCIAISPTWDENHRFTDAIRRKLKERRLLDKGVSFTVCNQLYWTTEQKKTAENYRPGMLVTFHADKKSPISGKTLEVAKVESGELWLKGYNKPVKLEVNAKRFSVSLARTIEVSEGDNILLHRPHNKAGLINGKVLTVNKINKDGSIETSDKDGKKVHVPADYRHFTHGYVVTSYKSQGRTSKAVVIAAEKLDDKAAYVSSSRGRHQAQIFTPDKVNFFDNLKIPTDRTAAADIIKKYRPDFWRKDEVTAVNSAWRQRLYSTSNYTNDYKPELGGANYEML